MRRKLWLTNGMRGRWWVTCRMRRRWGLTNRTRKRRRQTNRRRLMAQGVYLRENLVCQIRGGGKIESAQTQLVVSRAPGIEPEVKHSAISASWAAFGNRLHIYTASSEPLFPLITKKILKQI
jgi:hypothetical protein